jgi:hypothetical protein
VVRHRHLRSGPGRGGEGNEATRVRVPLVTMAPVASSDSSGVPAPLRWGLALLAGVAGGLALGFVLGLARPRTWPDPAALG